MDQKRTNKFFEELINEYRTCKDCIYYDEVPCTRLIMGGRKITWSVPICKGGEYINIDNCMRPCGKFQEKD